MSLSIIIAGFGGQGVLFAGSLLSHACILESKNTTWIPAYGAEMRGGTANCSVNIADENEHIASPVINKADIIIVLNQSSFNTFQNRVKKRGILICNAKLMQSKNRDDITYYPIDIDSYISKIETPYFINVFMIGILIKLTEVLSPENIIQALKEMIPEKKADLIKSNINSFNAGLNYIDKNLNNTPSDHLYNLAI